MVSGRRSSRFWASNHDPPLLASPPAPRAERNMSVQSLPQSGRGGAIGLVASASNLHSEGMQEGNNMHTPIIRRRRLLKTGVALSTLAIASAARAQAKLAPPNIIKAGTLVMSINPTLPPLQFVDDKGQLQGMRVEL